MREHSLTRRQLLAAALAAGVSGLEDWGGLAEASFRTRPGIAVGTLQRHSDALVRDLEFIFEAAANLEDGVLGREPGDDWDFLFCPHTDSPDYGSGLLTTGLECTWEVTLADRERLIAKVAERTTELGRVRDAACAAARRCEFVLNQLQTCPAEAVKALQARHPAYPVAVELVGNPKLAARYFRLTVEDLWQLWTEFKGDVACYGAKLSMPEFREPGTQRDAKQPQEPDMQGCSEPAHNSFFGSNEVIEHMSKVCRSGTLTTATFRDGSGGAVPFSRSR